MTDSRKPSPKAVQDALAALTPEQRRLLVRFGVRRRSEREFLGLPFYDIAMGPDPMSGQARGHAKGVIAIGDVATGIVALGGIARGVFALGGVALGLFSFGGLSIGLLGLKGGLHTIATGGGGMVLGPPGSFINDNNTYMIGVLMPSSTSGNPVHGRPGSNSSVISSRIGHPATVR